MIKLKNKPLVEAITEIRWILPDKKQPGLEGDPNYRVLLGRFSDRIQKEYTHHESLPAASVPDEMVAYNVQHRYRIANEKWPIVQIGPGIITFNETTNYDWTDFRRRSIAAFSSFIDSYPNQTDLKLSYVVLRYVDAIVFNVDSENAYSFLADKLNTRFCLPDSLFADTIITPRPKSFSLQTSHAINELPGNVTLRIASGKSNDKPAIILDTLVQSEKNHLNTETGSFSEWLDKAHKVTDDCFFKLIHGDLLKEFKGE